MLSSDDFRENPGTLALAASWLLVFALILLVQRSGPGPSPPPGPKWEPLPVSTVTSHRFGDMTWREVRDGQPWRLLTATFVHFGLVHVGLNTLGLVNLGRLVEPWYRTGPFLAICYAMGGLGNLVGGVLRQLVAVARPKLASMASAGHWPGSIERFLRGGPEFPVSIHTGGGSTILLGLLALGAVVGWRSRTRIGVHLQKQMLILLGLTAVMGLAMSGLVDNYGHLGGAIVGGAIGLFDRRLSRLAGSAWFRALCWAAVLGLTAACLGSAIREDQIERDYRRQLEEVVDRSRTAQLALAALDHAHTLYARQALRPDAHPPLDALAVADLMARGPMFGEPSKMDPNLNNRAPGQLGEVISQLDHFAGVPWGPEVAADLGRLRALLLEAVESPPRYDQAYEFAVCWGEARKAVAADLIRLNARLVEVESSRKRGR